MEKINTLCTNIQQYIQNITSDGIIMSVVLAFLAIFMLKGFRLSKKEILRALLILCIVNCIILNMYLENNKRKEEDKTKFNYFLNMDGLGQKGNTSIPSKIPDISNNKEKSRISNSKSEYSNQQFMFQEGKTLIL